MSDMETLSLRLANTRPHHVRVTYYREGPLIVLTTPNEVREEGEVPVMGILKQVGIRLEARMWGVKFLSVIVSPPRPSSFPLPPVEGSFLMAPSPQGGEVIRVEG